MPEAFIRCVRKGGKVVTVNPKEGVYLRVCYPKGGGSPIAGEVHHSKTDNSQLKEKK